MVPVYNLDGSRLYVYYFFDYDESFTLVSLRKISEEELRASVKKWTKIEDDYMDGDLVDEEYVTLEEWLKQQFLMVPLAQQASSPMYIRKNEC